MRILFLMFSLTFLLTSCWQPPDKKTKPIEPVSIRPSFSIIDSLYKYSTQKDSLYDFDSLRFYIAKVNDKRFSLFQVNDTTIFFYQMNADVWAITDTFYHSFVFVEPLDLNGDKFKDLRINYSTAGSNGLYFCLLYNPAIKQFRYNRYFDLPNIEYDNKRHLVFSAWWAGAVHPQEKMAYSITGDSLTFMEGVTYTPDELSDGKIGTVEFYKIDGGKKVITKKIKGQQKKTIGVFNKALWDTTMNKKSLFVKR